MCYPEHDGLDDKLVYNLLKIEETKVCKCVNIDCRNAFINIALVIPHYLHVHEGGCGYGDCAVELCII
jgi:hypothetical protein